MLKLILGRAGSGKTTLVLRRLCRTGKERPQVLMVPEQQSHQAERALCRAGGSGVSLFAEVLSFSRLANRVFQAAGGLGEDNLAEAIRQVRPWAVDLSSSLETGGLKDPEKIRRAVELVRGSGEETKRRKKCQKEDLEYTEASTFRRR